MWIFYKEDNNLSNIIKNYGQIYKKGEQFNVRPYIEVLNCYELVKKQFGNKTLKVLELGAGALNNVIALAEKGCKLDAVEPFSEPLEFGIKRAIELNVWDNITTYQMIANDFHFKPNKYHFIIDRWSLSYINEQKKFKDVIENIRKSLKDNGIFFQQKPYASSEIFDNNKDTVYLNKDNNYISCNLIDCPPFILVDDDKMRSYAKNLRLISREVVKSSDEIYELENSVYKKI